MGCAFSNSIEENKKEVRSANCMSCVGTTTTCSEFEVDISHFSQSEKILGIGGFGVVKLVLKLSGSDKSQPFALKSISKSAVLKRPTGPSAVLTELQCLALLEDHPFICNVRYAFQDQRFLYLVLDVAVGGDMRHHIRKAVKYRFVETVAKFYICQVLIAVEACHQANILHRDVKPENILMAENGYLKLSDFGVAKVLDDIESCRSTSGTHGYMAPEIYAGDHKHGTAVDWFAVGVTLHEFISGRRPFEASKLQSYRRVNSISDMDQGDSLSLDFLSACSHISDSCKDFIAALLVPQPSRRLGTQYGLKEIKAHIWLGDVDWDSIASHIRKPPHKPDKNKIVFADPNDADAKIAIKLHMASPPPCPSQQRIFRSYEYRNRIRTLPVLTSKRKSHGEGSATVRVVTRASHGTDNTAKLDATGPRPLQDQRTIGKEAQYFSDQKSPLRSWKKEEGVNKSGSCSRPASCGHSGTIDLEEHFHGAFKPSRGRGKQKSKNDFENERYDGKRGHPDVQTGGACDPRKRTNIDNFSSDARRESLSPFHRAESKSIELDRALEDELKTAETSPFSRAVIGANSKPSSARGKSPKRGTKY